MFPFLPLLASLASLASPPAPTEPPPSDAPSPARATFTPGKGIRWSSEDGRSALSVGLFTHVLGTVEHVEADVGEGHEEAVHELQCQQEHAGREEPVRDAL